MPSRPRGTRRLLPTTGPERTLALALATLVDTLGKGVFLSAGVIFLTRSAGLSAHAVGLGLTVAGVAALAWGVVIGDWADRLGARRVLTATLLLEAAATAGFAATHSNAVFLIAAVLAAIGAQGSTSARGALIAVIAGPEARVELRARLRSLTNLGISVGSVLGGIGLAVDSRWAYLALILGDAVTFLAAAAVVQRLPDHPPTRRAPSGRRWMALADHPYLAVTAVNAVQCLNFTMLTIAMPLWVSQRTAAPRWLVAPLLLINTVAIVVLQVRATRDVKNPVAAGFGLRRAGVAFAVAWTAMGLAGGAGPSGTIALLAAAVGVHTVGELWQAASGFELSFSLAHPDAQGQYQGVFGLGQGVASAVGPIVATGVCLSAGAAGWAGMGLLLAVAGCAAPATVARALRQAEVR
ncbi:hypothetical protein DSM104299_05493 [Baekduia alba]|uniref:MFS transporter n=1 Tax=Baekduia alba TaxID=2997333 RepID=UPI00233F9529|nr:MFS transporter [Baekduia alba]WCB96727.1 hypothetical protein DSM104299_05493 [Baekduia alba]